MKDYLSPFFQHWRLDLRFADEIAKACRDRRASTPEGELFVRAANMIDALEAERLRLEGEINAPATEEFFDAVRREAAHQRARWGAAHDAGKEPSDWFWLLGYLSGKALQAAVRGDLPKALHHTISSAAVLANWHAALRGETDMRPGIGEEARKDVEKEPDGR